MAAPVAKLKFTIYCLVGLVQEFKTPLSRRFFAPLLIHNRPIVLQIFAPKIQLGLPNSREIKMSQNQGRVIKGYMLPIIIGVQSAVILYPKYAFSLL